MALPGNIGEWSEVYVLLKLLADGKLYAADSNLNAISNAYYPIIKILRQENSNYHEYHFNESIKIFDTNNVELISLPISEFIIQSKKLLGYLKEASGRRIIFEDIELFLDSIKINKLTASNKDKSDIIVVVHDLKTGLQPQLGFSIKSRLGQDSTLFNPGAGTNFIFKTIHPSKINIDLKNFNKQTLIESKETGKSKISLRLTELENLGFNIEFQKIQSENLQLNLMLIDSQLPEILAQLLIVRYKTGKSQMDELIKIINTQNPLCFNLDNNHPFYEYKIKNFLTDVALGMTPETVWTGLYDATGGMIIVKEDGELACYHIYNKNEFQEYLVKNTKIEQPATSEDDDNPGNEKLFIKGGSRVKPYKFGWVYEEGGEYFIKINLQIRFTN